MATSPDDPPGAADIPVHASRWLKTTILISHLVAAGAAFVLPSLAASIALAGIGLSAGLHLRKEGDKITRICRIRCRVDGGLDWVDTSGIRPVISGRVLGERWVVLDVDRSAGDRGFSVLIAPDSVARDAHVTLRRAVLHGVKPGAAGAAPV